MLSIRSRQTSLAIDAVIVEADKLGTVVAGLADSPSSALMDIAEDDLNLEFTDDDALAAADEAATPDVDDAPVVRFLQKMLMDAIREGASDLHFEPYEKFYRIRFRIDGVLREIAQPRSRSRRNWRLESK